jgi:hypothetical protein
MHRLRLVAQLWWDIITQSGQAEDQFSFVMAWLQITYVPGEV